MYFQALARVAYPVDPIRNPTARAFRSPIQIPQRRLILFRPRRPFSSQPCHGRPSSLPKFTNYTPFNCYNCVNRQRSPPPNHMARSLAGATPPFCKGPMNLYILRHASAGTRRLHPQTDKKRGLDKEGKAQCVLIGNYLNALGVNFDVILSSPLKRSLQTASLVANEIGFESQIVIEDSLAPTGTFRAFEGMVREHAGQENILVVGHNPNLSHFLGSLICSPHRANVRLRKGSLARLDTTRRPAQLLSLIEPRALRQLYATVTKSSRRKTSRK